MARKATVNTHAAECGHVDRSATDSISVGTKAQQALTMFEALRTSADALTKSSLHQVRTATSSCQDNAEKRRPTTGSGLLNGSTVSSTVCDGECHLSNASEAAMVNSNYQTSEICNPSAHGVSALVTACNLSSLTRSQLEHRLRVSEATNRRLHQYIAAQGSTTVAATPSPQPITVKAQVQHASQTVEQTTLDEPLRTAHDLQRQLTQADDRVHQLTFQVQELKEHKEKLASRLYETEAKLQEALCSHSAWSTNNDRYDCNDTNNSGESKRLMASLQLRVKELQQLNKTLAQVQLDAALSQCKSTQRGYGHDKTKEDCTYINAEVRKLFASLRQMLVVQLIQHEEERGLLNEQLLSLQKQLSSCDI